MKQRTNIFKVKDFQFPYYYKFPGQASDEEILYVVRENKIMLHFRRAFVMFLALLILLVGFGITNFLSPYVGMGIHTADIFIMIIAVVILLLGYWWVSKLWKNSMAIVTTKRLKKIIYTTPFNKHSLSLPLEMIVDTGSYSKGFFAAIMKLGTFTARSSASSSGAATDDNKRVNKKYFYIENVSHVEDLQHYISKVLSAFRRDQDKIKTFRPFIPHLKGDARKKFMEQYPEYWS